jgi:hypothetical protein
VISRTTRSFWRRYDALPQEVREQAARAWRIWRQNPFHPSLQFKCISQKHAAWSIRIGIHFRALAYREARGSEDMVTWFWIGSHSEYDKLISEL